MRTTRTASLNAEINVTPLVDVCLVLLIIFMLFMPALTGNNVEVQLPETHKVPDADKRMLPITVKADGTVYVDKLVVRRDEVPAALQRLHGTAASRPIGVRGDKRVMYGEVVDVLAAARDAGWRDVALVTVERPGVH
jgi:biopolymer transport protein ExbD